MELSPSAHLDTFCRDNLPPQELWPQFTDMGYPDRLNCAQTLLDDTIARFGPERPCLTGSDDEWTYGELLEISNRIARVLVSLGVLPGNRVLLRGPNNPWLVACWFGVLKAGAVAVTTMALLRRQELDAIREISRPSLALCDDRFLAEMPPDLKTVSYGKELAGLCSQVRTNRPFRNVETAADDVALLAFTSGTTGRPKGTLHFHRDVLAIADTFSEKVLKPRPTDVFTGTPPLGFTFGLGGSVIFPLRAGASTLLLEKSTPSQLAVAVDEFGANILFTAPTAYRAMLAEGKARHLRGLRRCVSAGESLPAAVFTAFHQATGLKIIDGIGATEMLHIFISAEGDDIRPGATGKAVPGYEAAVLDLEGHPVPDGTPGQLAVKGPTGCRYLADEGRQRIYVRDGWNFTGDTYIRDTDGYFHFQARSDDMIISSGYNIAGPEVEGALLQHPDVVACGVVGAPDKARGEVVTAFIVLRPGVEGTAGKTAELQEFVKQTIAPYKYPRSVRFVDELPYTSTGKLRRHQLRSEV